MSVVAQLSEDHPEDHLDILSFFIELSICAGRLARGWAGLRRAAAHEVCSLFAALRHLDSGCWRWALLPSQSGACEHHILLSVGAHHRRVFLGFLGF